MLDKAWITPEWGYIETEAQEHTRLALCRMLYGRQTCDIPADWVHRWSAWPKKDLARLKSAGVKLPVLKFLAEENADPRTYVMREFAWIRVFTSPREQGFMLWHWDSVALALIQEAAKDWLPHVRREETVTIEALHPHSTWSTSVKRLISPSATAAGLAGVAEGLASRYHGSQSANPELPNHGLDELAETIAGKIAARAKAVGTRFTTYDDVYEMTKRLLRESRQHVEHTMLYPLVIGHLAERNFTVREG